MNYKQGKKERDLQFLPTLNDDLLDLISEKDWESENQSS